MRLLNIVLGRPIKSCRAGTVLLSMDIFPALFGQQNSDENIEYSPRPTNQERVVWTMYCLWTFSGNVFVTGRACIARRHRSFSPLSAPTCIIYGRFTALFERPCCMALSTNRTLSAPTCNIYGRFSALFPRPFINIYDQSNLVGTYV